MLSVRYTAEEFDRLVRLAGAQSLSDYVRTRSLDRQLALSDLQNLLRDKGECESS